MMDHFVLEHLVTLNRSVEAAIDILKKLAAYPELQDDGFVARQSYFREHLADANVSILEALHESEETIGGAAYMERREYEKTVRDPDDCYLEVMHREKERQQQGLPSRIGVGQHVRSRRRSALNPRQMRKRNPTRTRKERNGVSGSSQESMPFVSNGS